MNDVIKEALIYIGADHPGTGAGHPKGEITGAAADIHHRFSCQVTKQLHNRLRLLPFIPSRILEMGHQFLERTLVHMVVGIFTAVVMLVLGMAAGPGKQAGHPEDVFHIHCLELIR